MQEDARQRFQGLCLQSTEGSRWMNLHFDALPPAVRERLRESPFNLCPACVADIAYGTGMSGSAKERMMKAIDIMEEQVSAGN